AALVAIPVIAAESPRTPTVDYVIGMLEAGMDPQEITDIIHEHGLAFKIEPGDLDRLRAAGADDELMQAVGGAPGADVTAPGAPPPEATAPQPSDEGKQATQEAPRGGYPYYVPGEDRPYYRPPYYVYYGYGFYP